jgi:hypothetical protein
MVEGYSQLGLLTRVLDPPVTVRSSTFRLTANNSSKPKS